MADEQPKRKLRRLRPAPVTMRERAERSTTSKPKRKLPFRIRMPFGNVFGAIGSSKVWQVIKAAFRFLGKMLLPPYIRNSWAELRKVEWPSRKQSLQLTSAVIIFSVVFGVIVAIFDFGLDKLFKQVIVR